jgi:hypothetical protein
MPDVTVLCVPKEEPPEALAPSPDVSSPPPPPPLPKSLLAKLRRLLFLPIRTVRVFLNRLIMGLCKRFFGPQRKP